MSFVHLQVASAYSLLTSTSTIKGLVKKAQREGFEALALTDHNVMYGAIPFYKECKKNGIKPIIGLTVQVETDAEGSTYPIVLLAKSNRGYEHLMKISSVIQTHSNRSISAKWLKGYSEDLYAITPGIEGEVEQLLIDGNVEGAVQKAAFLKSLFDLNSFYLGVQHHRTDFDDQLEEGLRLVSSELSIPLVATNHSVYVDEEDAFAQECLLALKDGNKLSDEGRKKMPGERYDLRSKAEMIELFSTCPEWLENSLIITKNCHVDLQFHNKLLPKYPMNEGETAFCYLLEKCKAGLKERRLEGKDDYIERMNDELEVIRNMNFEDYFLIVWDFMKYARDKGILTGPGRGSAAGSLVAYLLKITEVDPIAFDLLFERFLNPARVSMPDIDIDFPDNRRDEVIAYVAKKYGALQVAQIITFGTFGTKAALRDAARIFGFNSKELEQLSKAVPSKLGITLKEAYAESSTLRNLIHQSEIHEALYAIALKWEGLPRHTSTHAAGVVIADRPLVNNVPLQGDPQSIFLTQYPMEVLEELGLLKMDFLGLRNLTILDRILKQIRRKRNGSIHLSDIPLQDEKTFEMLSKGDTLGVFQLESSGMVSVLKRLKPTEFEDIVAVNALYRPGPMEQIPTYIERKHHRQSVELIHPDLENILKKTYGVIVYQEQIIQIASKFAGFTLGEADLLRRAVSKKKKEVLDQEREHFVAGALHKGYEEQTAHRLYDLIVSFANYGFNRSHAVAYSMIAYQLAYLKTHFPTEFLASLLSSAMGNEDKLAIYVQEASKMGIAILPPSIQQNDYGFIAEEEGIRLSLAIIKGVGMSALRELIQTRQNKPFEDLFDLCIRLPEKLLNRKLLENLIFAGALDSFGQDRAVLLASLDVAFDHAELVRPVDGELVLFSDDDVLMPKPMYVQVDKMTAIDKLSYEKETTGLFLSNHPVSAYQELWDRMQIHSLATNLIQKGKIKVAIYVNQSKVIRTKKGEAMAFLVLSDSTNEIEATCFPTIYKRYTKWCKEGEILIVEGKIDERQGKLQLIVERITPLDDAIALAKDADKKLYIKIPKELHSNENLVSLREILRKHHGYTSVILAYEKEHNTVQLSKDDSVLASEELLLSIRKLVGDTNVVLK
jgi:DNA polymerase-3 subunit alpha